MPDSKREVLAIIRDRLAQAIPAAERANLAMLVRLLEDALAETETLLAKDADAAKPADREPEANDPPGGR